MSKESKTTRVNRITHKAAIQRARRQDAHGYRFRERHAVEPLYRAKVLVASDVEQIGGKIGIIECVQHYAPYDREGRRTNADCTPDAAIAVKVDGKRVRLWISMRKLTVIEQQPRPEYRKRRTQYDERFYAMARRAVRKFRRAGGRKQSMNEPGIYDHSFKYDPRQPKPPGWLKHW